MARAVRNTGVPSNEERFTHQPVPSNALKIKLDYLRTFEALTENQQKFFDIYKKGGYFMFCLGSPGTGKTFLSFYRAIEEVLSKDNNFKQVVIVRSVVPTRDVGFLPGSLEEKQEVYELPYREAAAILFGKTDAWDRLKEQGYVRFLSTTAIRGISIDNSIVIVDEAQNCRFGELSTVLTRVGHQTKIIFCGDRFQDDLTTKKNDVSGLKDFLAICRTMRHYEEVVYTSNDIVRSSLVKDFLIACEKANVLPNN